MLTYKTLEKKIYQTANRTGAICDRFGLLARSRISLGLGEDEDGTDTQWQTSKLTRRQTNNSAQGQEALEAQVTKRSFRT